jgi:CheY-like chemotaxis protein
MTRILAIEPNPERAQALRQLVHDRLGADVVLAESTAAAIAAMTKQAADLILTSILLPPNDESQLTVYLRECDQASTVPVLLIPPVVEECQVQPADENWWSRLARTRRGSPPWPPYDAEAVAGRIRDALAPATWETEAPRAATVAALLRFDKNVGINGKPRAERWAQTDLPWLSSVNLSTGREVKLLNISSSGILIDSEFRLAPGRPTEFQLWGPYKQLVVAARIVRSEGSMSDRGDRYRTAAAFDFNVDLKA